MNNALRDPVKNPSDEVESGSQVRLVGSWPNDQVQDELAIYVVPSETRGRELQPTGPETSLWDSFWVKHGSGQGLLNKTLWGVRYIFSRHHAKLMMERCAQGPASSNHGFKALEIGCGSATTSAFISQIAAESEIFAVDLSMEAIKVARSRNPELTCVIADALALPFAEEIFSLAFSSGVIEHFGRPTAHKMFREHWRVTKIAGTAAVTVPWKHSLYNLLRMLVGRYWPYGHEDPFSIDELRLFAQSHFVNNIKVRCSYGTTLTGLSSKAEPQEEVKNFNARTPSEVLWSD